ncbi:MAG: EAL domain-containing protein [Acidimicrobiia bacterium]
MRQRRKLWKAWPELTVVFQPIVDLDRRTAGSAGVVGLEALARFPGIPRLSPMRVFETARAGGGGVALELRAIAVALSSLGRLDDGRFLSLNASPEVLKSRDLRAMLAQVDATRVVVEVTETAPINDYASFNRSVDALRQLGVRLAVDDLGAGFASLRHLLHLRPEIMKLDLDVVDGISLDRTRQSLVLALASLGADIGADVVAEGIESSDEVQAVRLFGVQYGQGFFLGRPAPPGK